MNSSNLESGISLPQVSVMSTMQIQALFAVLRDFDLAGSRRGLLVDEAASLRTKLGLRFPESGTECVLRSQMFSVREDVHKGPEHSLRKTLREEWCPALLAIAPQIMEETPRKPMLPAKIMLVFHFKWFDWHDMVTKVPVPSASGITNVPPPDFFSILQNLRFGVFTLLPEYPLRYCSFTASAGGGNCRGGGIQTLKGEETGEKPRRGKQAVRKTGGGGGT